MAQLVLNIPDEMVPQVMTAIRANYGPIVTDDMDPLTAMRVVARFWLGGLMAEYAGQQARAAGDAQVTAAAQAREQAIKSAKDQARAAVDAIPWGEATATAHFSITAAATGSVPT